MNFKNANKTFKVVLSVGDESGIGPEIILKALCSNEIPKNIDFTLVGSKKNLQNTYKHLRSLGLKNLANPENLKIDEDTAAIYIKGDFNGMADGGLLDGDIYGPSIPKLLNINKKPIFIENFFYIQRSINLRRGKYLM